MKHTMAVQMKQVLDSPAFATEVDWSMIRSWADSEDGGQLPYESAGAFATWLNENWDDWTDDESATVKNVLEGAVTDWCGGRTF